MDLKEAGEMLDRLDYGVASAMYSGHKYRVAADTAARQAIAEAFATSPPEVHQYLLDQVSPRYLPPNEVKVQQIT